MKRVTRKRIRVDRPATAWLIPDDGTHQFCVPARSGAVVFSFP